MISNRIRLKKTETDDNAPAFVKIHIKAAYQNCNWSFFWFIWIFCFLKIGLASDIPMILNLYQMVLRCNNEPENLENIVWKADFYPGH